MSLELPPVIPNDWNRLRVIVDKLRHLRLGPDSSPVFTGLTLDILTTDDVNTDTITIKDSDGNIVFYVDVNEMYFTASVVIPIEAGMPIGLALALTYAAP